MKALCVGNIISYKNSHLHVLNSDKSLNYAITVGQWYIIYGISVINGIPCFFVLEDDRLDYPAYIPISCFSAVRGTLPAGLTVRYFVSDDSQSFSISGPCLIEKDNYDKLTDGEEVSLVNWTSFMNYVNAWEDVCLRSSSEPQEILLKQE